MYKKIIRLAIITLLILNDVDGRKTKKNKRTKEEDDSTPQPNLVTYSTFGFNDVGSYDGFMPSSPDYVNYLSSYNQESSTRLYAPAFPTALESSGVNSFVTHGQDTQPFDSGPQASMFQYPQSSKDFFKTPNLDNSDPQNQNEPEEIYGRNIGEVNAPVYGTKIPNRNKYKSFDQINNTDFNVYSSGPANPTDEKFSIFPEIPSAYESKPTSFGEPVKNYHSSYSFVSNYPSSDNDDFKKPTPTKEQNSLTFPKVVDFTKFKQYYPSDPNNEYPTSATIRPSNTYDMEIKIINENNHLNKYEENNNQFSNPISTSFSNTYNDKEIEEVTEKQIVKPVSYGDNDYTQNYFSQSSSKNTVKSPSNLDFKDKFKYKTWTNYTNDNKKSKNPFKGYQYSTNFSNMTFEFDFGTKKPFNSNHDEIISASSNIVDLPSYQFPESEYPSFKKQVGPKTPFGEVYTNAIESVKHSNKYDPVDYVRNLYSTVPTTTTHWGNVYKTSEYSSYKHHQKKPQYVDEINDDVVHIPKRPHSNKYNYEKYSESKPNDWPTFSNYRSYKSKKPVKDWTKEASNTRFKSEEDIMGLRNHDTSHPAYLPNYKPSNNGFPDDFESYKKLVEKWRQSYVKAKYKDLAFHDYEGYSTEPKPLHVPVPKPYAIEVPHPVIVPVPQPYPVRVPVPKPVAVPVVRELTVPVEKPVPYPVIKKVPFPIEKPVPVPVEKEVPVPVVKPYPVPIPHIRPVFHHTRPREEMDAGFEMDEEDDYLPRPDSSKKIPHIKRPRNYSTRTRSQRPTRTYQDRNRRRWPSRRPSGFTDHKYPPRGSSASMDYQYKLSKHHDDIDDYDHGPSDYMIYCKRTGNC